MLKIVGVGDPVIPEDTMEEIFRQQKHLKGEFQKASWGLRDPGQLQKLRSIYEEKGPGAVPAPRHIVEQAADASILVVHFTPLSGEIPLSRSRKALRPRRRLVSGWPRRGSSTTETLSP